MNTPTIHQYEIISRADAKARGLTMYYTGAPCKHGHVARRFAVNGDCTECSKAKSRRLYRKFHKQRLEQAKKWADENKEKRREIARNYMRRNKQKYKEYAEKNKEQINKTKSAWKQRNKDAVRTHTINRRTRIKSSGKITAKDIERIMSLQKHKCAYCRTSLSSGYHVDHITPIARGGLNIPSNIQMLCQSCNLRKSYKDPLVFARQSGRLL